MRYIRVVHLDHYDHKKGNFKDLAFRPQRDAGGKQVVSVFEEDCAIKTNEFVCCHIERFYKEISSDPSVYWPFDQSDLGPDVTMAQVAENDDECHYHIMGLSGTKLRKVPSSWKIADLIICAPGAPRPLELADIPLQEGA